MNENEFILAIYTRLLTDEEKEQIDLPEDVNPNKVPLTQSDIFQNMQDLDEFLMNPDMADLDIKLLSKYTINDEGHIVGN